MSTLMQDDGPIATGQKVMLASTAYDSPDASYTFSIQSSREALTASGIQSAYILLSGNCHVDDARNSVVHAFMQSDCTDLIFLDADVSWNKHDIVKMCQFDLDLVGCVYPYKRPGEEGMPYRSLPGAEIVDGLLEVEGLPTGFMRIRRNVLDIMIPHGDVYSNMQRNITDIPLLFERTLEDGVRLGGDLTFCRKWRDEGGKLYAYTEAHLGHSVKTVIYDSLGAHARREAKQTLSYVVDKIRDGSETETDYEEVQRYVGNSWSVDAGRMLVVVSAARMADGHIIEAGSGITTILMAAANPAHQVWCIEHNPHYANETREMARRCKLNNIMMIHCDIAEGWYNIPPQDKIQMPAHFGMGFNDGPPRYLCDRTRFLDEYGHRCDTIVCDDADDAEYSKSLTAWAVSTGRAISFPTPSAAIIMKDAA